jgi:hypothetical protein
MERWLEEGLRCACLSIEECRIVDQATAMTSALSPIERCTSAALTLASGQTTASRVARS